MVNCESSIYYTIETPIRIPQIFTFYLSHRSIFVTSMSSLNPTSDPNPSNGTTPKVQGVADGEVKVTASSHQPEIGSTGKPLFFNSIKIDGAKKTVTTSEVLEIEEEKIKN